MTFHKILREIIAKNSHNLAILAIILRMSDEFFMELALKEAWKYQLLTYPNPAVGCVIVGTNGEILSINAHKKAGLAHAELGAISLALSTLLPHLKPVLQSLENSPNELYDFILKHHGGVLKNASAFVTLEPCAHRGKTPPCALLLRDLGFKKVVFGSSDSCGDGSGGANILKNAGVLVLQSELKDECDELLEPFISWQNGSFTFLKIALSKNGVYSGKISGDEAQKHCHEIRSKLDFIAIGGKTTRHDRPTLDARFSTTKHAPNALIYSKSKDFDKEIPLFKVPNRKVEISNSIEILKNSKFSMIECGQNLLNTLSQQFKWLLIYENSSFKIGEFLKSDLKLKIMNKTPLGDDTALWCKIQN